MRIARAGLALAAGLALVASVAPAAPAAAVQPGPATDLVSIQLDQAGQLTVEAGPVRGNGTLGTVPDHAAYRFLGEPGQPVWALASVDNAGYPSFPGIDATGVAPERTGNGTVSLELVDVTGPGTFHAYTLSPVGRPQLLFGTSPRAPRQAALAAGERLGGLVWAFGASGDYQVTLAANVVLAGGGNAAGQATYQLTVPEFAAGALRDAVPLAGPVPEIALPPVVPQQAQPGGEQVVIGDGHVDIGPRFVDGDWTIQVKDDTVSPVAWRDLHDVVLQVVDQAAIEVPDSGDFDFLGTPGDTVWLLPQAQQAGILWPGWNTEDPSVLEEVSGNTTWRLHQVAGPGEFVLFLTGSFGQSQVLFTTREGLPQEMAIPPRTHAHGNWAFTEPGVYHLTIEMSATTTGGDQVTDTRVLAFAVGDVDPSTAFPPGGNGNGNGGGGMPKTGFAGLVTLIVAGAVLLAAGTLLVLVTIRRRRRVPA